MALQFSSLLVTTLPCSASLPSARDKLKICSANKPAVQCIPTSATTIDNDDQGAAALRRSANYAPSSWDYNFIKSLTSDYTEEKYAKQIDELKDDVKRLIQAETDVTLDKLELLDSVQRLGLNYKFQEDVKQAVDIIHNDYSSVDAWLNDNLYSTALRFRILRQHGYTVPQDVFRRFKDETCDSKANLREDVKGLLSLYEASFFGFKGEDIIDEAKAFSTKHLKNAAEGKISPNMERKLKYALDMPLHWKLPRLEARWCRDLNSK